VGRVDLEGVGACGDGNEPRESDECSDGVSAIDHASFLLGKRDARF
jgi:hypothetical protein